MIFQWKQAIHALGRNLRVLRKMYLLLLFATVVPFSSVAQINCNGGDSSKMVCLIPTTLTPKGYGFSNSASLGSASSNFAFLNEDIGGEISQIPLASPASGIVFTTDPTLHVPVPSDQSLGPILTQRADTIGRHKLYIAQTYQYFLLQDVDGHGLSSLPVALPLIQPGSSTADTVALANSRIDLKVHQWVGYATFGLTSRIDVSVAVPLLRVDMRYTATEQIVTPAPIGSNMPFPPQTSPSNAREVTGIGDVVLAAKGTVWKRAKGGGFAIGAEVRLPSGDPKNFLGSGTYGVKPFAAFTYGGRVSPHVNIGYQANGNTVLVTSSTGGKGQLPNRLIYSGGADWRAIRGRLTFAADVIAERVFNGLQAQVQTFPPSNPGIITIGSSSISVLATTTARTSSYNRTDGSVGLKLKPFGKLLITGNLLVKLDQGGLRERLAPLVGASYTF